MVLGEVSQAAGNLVGDFVQAAKPPEDADTIERARCEAQGGTWDAVNRVCILPPPPEPPKQDIQETPDGVLAPEVFKDQAGRISGVELPDGRTFLGLSPDEVREITEREQGKRQLPQGAVPVGTSRAIAEQQAQSQLLASQVGQTSPSTGLTPTDLSQGDALTRGLVDAVPRALTLAGGAAVAGAAAGAATTGGVASIPLAAAGAAVTFVGSIASSMLSDIKRQRTDNTNAQKRVLDEGKQTLSDWVTLAKANPEKRAEYLAGFNIQLQRIQDAHRQMRLDTNADVGKFETAIPDLAEFNEFYAAGGERDALVNEMREALVTPASVEFQMLELANRRKS